MFGNRKRLTDKQMFLHRISTTPRPQPLQSTTAAARTTATANNVATAAATTTRNNHHQQQQPTGDRSSNK